MKHVGVILKTMPFYRGVIEHQSACSETNGQGTSCDSKTQVLFCFESESRHVGALCCQSCGQVKERLLPRNFVALVSGLAGEHLPTEVSPHE